MNTTDTPPMPKLSRRVRALAPSATVAVANKAKAMRAQGIDVLSFAAGEPDFDTPQAAKDAAVAAIAQGKTKYAPTQGPAPAREAIAKKLREENGMPDDLTAAHVMLSIGGKQVLYMLMQALFDTPENGEAPGELLLPTPAWVSYAPQARLAGAKIVEIPGAATNDFKITPAQLQAAITPQSKALIFNSPCNPTGMMYTPDEIDDLAEVVAKAAAKTAPDLVIVADEIYEKILLGDTEHRSIGAINSVKHRTVTVSGMAKAYAMTGWRLGYAACPGEFGMGLIKALSKVQTQINTAVVTFAAEAIPACFQACEDDVQRMRNAFAARAERLCGGLNALSGVVCPKPMGAFYAFPDISTYFGSVTPEGRNIDSSLAFAEAFLEEQRVAVVPGEAFLGDGERCVRMSFACAEAQIDEGLERLGAFLKSLESKH